MCLRRYFCMCMKVSVQSMPVLIFINQPLNKTLHENIIIMLVIILKVLHFFFNWMIFQEICCQIFRYFIKQYVSLKEIRLWGQRIDSWKLIQSCMQLYHLLKYSPLHFFYFNIFLSRNQCQIYPATDSS